MVHGLTDSGQLNSLQSDVTTCNQFAVHFRQKLEEISWNLDSPNVSVDHVEMSSAPSCPILLDLFQLVASEEVDRTLLTTGLVLSPFILGHPGC